MIKTEQGVLQLNKPVSLLIHILLLLTFFLTYPASAKTPPADTLIHENKSQKHHVFIIYSPDNALHSSITQHLSENLNLKRPDIIISKATPEEIINKVDKNTDIIIGIGNLGIKSADKYYPKTKKLFISIDPGKNRLDINKNKNAAILYMAQSYCRQIQFIKLLNPQWKTISILSSEKKPIDIASIKQCTNLYNVNIYTVNTTADKNLTSNIRDALGHSDVLLALPDSSIYNSKTAKNILLTSYRNRKPVIAFSQNFVNAGALAAIHSSAEQIAQSASLLIEQYYRHDQQFNKPVNYPQSFNISINRQVFRALDLPIPDIGELKQVLEGFGPDKPGDL